MRTEYFSPIVRKLLKTLGASKSIIITHSDYYLFAFPAVFIYLGLFFAKIIIRKKIVLCKFRTDRIGHLACNTEVFLRRLKYGNRYSKNAVYIGVYNPFAVSNYQLLNMYKRHFLIVGCWLLDKMFKTWLSKTDFCHVLPFNSNEYYELNNCEPILSFTDEEEKKGRKLLATMGIGKNDWFVCFHSRDSKYLDSARFRYHDYRDSDIESYMKAAEYIAGQGGYAIRIGSAVETPLPRERHPRVIDYSMEYRSDFMDIYLLAHCKFLIGNTSGICWITLCFNVPAALPNWVALECPALRKDHIFIPKKLWSADKQKFLGYKEILDSGVGFYLTSQEYEKAGIKIINSSADEILELTKEIYMQLDGQYRYSAEDEKRQRAFWSLYKPGQHGYGCPARIGTQFLRDNLNLLSTN